MSSHGALPGFRDFFPSECAEREHIFGAWRAVARRYGFVEYDGPPLEPLDLYTKKSGDEIVGQLYAFEDKGGRSVALRPEMTPTFARMVSARANALRKPVKWFSIPQLFRYERAQKGRLREHFQLNVDIVGEPGPVADAELLAVAADTMAAVGLGPADVRVRVSDRRLLFAALDALGFDDVQRPVALAVIDKLGRQPREVSVGKLSGAGVEAKRIDALLTLVEARDIESFLAAAGGGEAVTGAAGPLRAALGYADALGVGAWLDFDPGIVRGLAYYTGIVFELFDAKGEFRAICGGGRYDGLLKSLGGVDLPALGFGMGDVVLSELLRARSLMPGAAEGAAEAYVVGGQGSAGRPYADALRLVRALRSAGIATDHALSAERYGSQAPRNQLETARKTGARAAVFFEDSGDVSALWLGGRLGDAPRWTAPAARVLDGTALPGLRAWLDSTAMDNQQHG
jgi:histidyl-tRNA synthetase